MQIKKYKNDFTYSYTLGPFPSFELITSRPKSVLEVHISQNFNEKEKLISLCDNHSIPYVIGEKTLQRISDKDKCYVSAVFEKYEDTLQKNAPHIVLVNPSDMGNLGTIIRSMLAFNIKNLAIIKPAADVFNPKVIRASMGAIFKINVQTFDSFESYSKIYESQREFYPFMLLAKTTLSPETSPKSKNFSLIFGNESSGLPDYFKDIGTPILIPQSEEVDSLNLGVSVALASFIFSQNSN